MIRRCTICEFVVRFWDILTGIVTNYHQPHFFLLDIRILRKALASACASCLCLYFTAPWCLLWELKVHRPYRGRKGIGTSWKYHETELLWNLVETSSPSGGFLQWWYPTTMGFPTKNDHFEVFWGYHHLRKHPNCYENWWRLHHHLCSLKLLFSCSLEVNSFAGWDGRWRMFSPGSCPIDRINDASTTQRQHRTNMDKPW